MWSGVVKLLQMIRFEHSVFALPFAVAAALYATRGEVLWRPFGWILLAMVTARTAAMAFNRISDLRFDALNPRTRDRHLPSGAIPYWQAATLVGVSSGLFVLAAGMLNKTCLIASGPLLLYLLGYSFSKRFTWLSHLYLGTTLGLSPVGVWVGLTETVEAFPLYLGAAITLWVAGFDVIYACLDEAFDREIRLHSIPARFGIRAALVVSALCHAATAGTLLALGLQFGLGWLYWSLLVPILLVLAYEHWMVRPDDLGRVNVAFFNANAVFSVALMAALVADLLSV
ncbi:MAG TPA: UbiA-like polyprenyltransferase [Planctomycetota bacterium]|nr:UbiA-like polyprenyltransferase [Planctomycetota bacterium]